MQKIHRVNEFALLRFTQCPLFEPGIDDSQPADIAAVDAAVEDVLAWLTKETFELGLPPLAAVREHAEAFFSRHNASTMTQRAARYLVRASRRLHDLVTFNKIHYPYTAYELDLGEVRVEGNITLISSKTRASLPPRIVRLRRGKIEPPTVPDVVSMARWLYGLRESGYPRIMVHIYSLTSDKVSNQEFQEPLAQRWLTAAAMNWKNSREYPNPGAHCARCSKPCLKNEDLLYTAGKGQRVS